ncbi:hypothetical protein Ddye_030751 [Dipteronia dyeriana]|uniref:Uncharacterized protein n=1 Tax=Dipteronia dyeriana TaxID=168575 RepID=A0AAD9THZ1_9ROSI|nr:hypothetical protein Ddye_030751 [Dipteronia dyeriana]
MQRGLARTLLDHNDILVGENNEDWGPSLFPFFNAKIKVSKGRMKKWLKANKKYPSSFKDIEVRLAVADRKANREWWTENLRKKHLSHISKLWMDLRREEQPWRQKSRVKWLKEGDKNSIILHFMANGRRRGNHISEISFDSTRVLDPTRVREGVLNFFKEHFSNV